MNTYDPNYIYTPALFTVGVKVVVIHSITQKILLIQRSEKCSRPHGWDFPGGGVDTGEDPGDACVREAQEETGVSIYNIQPITTSIFAEEGKPTSLVIGYRANTDSEDVVLSWEHESYQWASLDEIANIDLPSLHTKILEAIITHK